MEPCISGLPPGLIVVLTGVAGRSIVRAVTLPLETSFAPILSPSGSTASLGSEAAGRSVLVVTVVAPVGLSVSFFSLDKVGVLGRVAGDGRESVPRRHVGVSEVPVLVETAGGSSGLDVAPSTRLVGVASLSDMVGREISRLVTTPRSGECPVDLGLACVPDPIVTGLTELGRLR